eukprot:1160315-Pelagomonas_calceolata.AAC.4
MENGTASACGPVSKRSRYCLGQGARMCGWYATKVASSAVRALQQQEQAFWTCLPESYPLPLSSCIP